MNEKVLVFDNFLEQRYFAEIQELLMGRNFCWYYKDSVNESTIEEKRDLDTFQFAHLFFSVKDGGVCSNHFNILKPILEKLNAQVILKVKSNLLTKNENPKYFGYHIDSHYPTSKTSIFYINTNNGSTIFKDGTVVDSKENRMVVFDSDIMHTGKPCSDQSTRVLINFNYFDY